MVFFFLPSFATFSCSTPVVCIRFMIGYVVVQDNWSVAAGKPALLFFKLLECVWFNFFLSYHRRFLDFVVLMHSLELVKRETILQVLWNNRQGLGGMLCPIYNCIILYLFVYLNGHANDWLSSGDTHIHCCSLPDKLSTVLSSCCFTHSFS